jgi:DNA polymerase I-like protein with 3'-5' exonuclease and polymerase domains
MDAVVDAIRERIEALRDEWGTGTDPASADYGDPQVQQFGSEVLELCAPTGTHVRDSMSTSKTKWQPPDDPDLGKLAKTAWANWLLDKPKVISFDTETTGLTYQDRAFGASIAWQHGDEIQGNGVVGHWFDWSVDGAKDAVAQIMGYADVLVAHNAKYDLHKLAADGIRLRPDQHLHDTEAMAHLVDEHQPKGLKALAVNVLGFDDTIEIPAKRKNPETGLQEDWMKPIPKSKWEIDQARAWAKKAYDLDSVDDVGYHMLPRGTLVPYAILDAVWTLKLASILMPKVLQFPEVTELYDREIELTRGAIFAMEEAGMAVDLPYVQAEILTFRKSVTKMELQIEGIVGKPVRTGKMKPAEVAQYFNPASPKQIAEYFKAAGFDRASYDAEQLEGIAHPLADTLLAYRGEKKLLESYLEALAKETGPDGIYHMSSRQHGTVTGRTSNGAERGD